MNRLYRTLPRSVLSFSFNWKDLESQCFRLEIALRPDPEVPFDVILFREVEGGCLPMPVMFNKDESKALAEFAETKYEDVSGERDQDYIDTNVTFYYEVIEHFTALMDARGLDLSTLP